MTKRKTTHKRKRRRRSGLMAGPGGMLKNPIVAAAIGGAGAVVLLKFAGKMLPVGMDTPVIKGIAIAGLGFAVGKMLKQPAIGAGMVAIGAGLLVSGKDGLHDMEDNDFLNDAYSLSDEMADAYSLSDEMADAYSLSAGGRSTFNTLYPNYVNPGFYDSDGISDETA